MSLTSSDYRGPLVIVAIGGGFILVGAVPVAVTFSIGVRTSAKIIGMGFMGFGLLLMLPGLCWCVWVRVNAFRKRHWPSSSSANNASATADDGMRSMVGEDHEDDDNTHGEKTGAGTRKSARTRSWPSSYIDPPLLIVADNEVCNAAICIVTPSTQSSTVNNGGVTNTVEDSAFVEVSDQLPATSDHTQPPPPLRTQRSDPGPTDRTTDYDQSVTHRPRTADVAPP